MAKFVALISWTEQGVKNYRDSVERARAGAAAAEKLGGKLTKIYWTLGAYDLVALTEFPDDETATAFALALSSQGNVRTTTMRAYDEAEMTAIVAKNK
jgi:uncharacterized protein with GYD domain